MRAEEPELFREMSGNADPSQGGEAFAVAADPALARQLTDRFNLGPTQNLS